MTEVRKFVVSVILALATVPAVAFLWKSPVILAGVLCAIGAAMLVVEWDKKIALTYFLAFFGGPISEMVTVYFDTWTYTNPQFVGVPLWLPFLWGSAAAFLVRAYLFFGFLFRTYESDST